MKYFNFIIRLIVAGILLQTLFFKFSAHAQSVELFTKIVGDQEAYLRITTGILELIAALLILIPRTQVLGALKVSGIMAGALVSHFLFLGFSGDDLPLSIMAVVALSGSLYTLYAMRKDINYLNLFS